MKPIVLIKFLIFFIFISCSDPVTPEFKFKSGLISVEGFVSNLSGSSFVKLKKLNEFNIGLKQYVNAFIDGASVSFVNVETGEIVTLIKDIEKELYLPPNDFVSATGETWELNILLEDGKEIKSLPEKMVDLIEISKTSVNYDPELLYSNSLGKFIPGHSINVDFNDPPEKRNYYYWSFRTFEKKMYCKICYSASVYRDGVCESLPDPTATLADRIPYFTYLCESDCWQIRHNSNINIFSDDYTNGSIVQQLPVANILLYRKKDILVELQQYSLSAAAYKYYKVLKDIIDDNSGLNSPPPAALLGNIFNPNDSDEIILGRFTVAAASKRSIFIERLGIKESEIAPDIIEVSESSFISAILPEDEKVFEAPCGPESRYSTGIRPEGWQ